MGTTGNSHLSVERDYVGRLNTRLGPWVVARLLPRVPAGVTPNQVTVAGCLCGIGAGLGFFLASFHHGWFLVAVVGMLLFWLADNLDGELARARALVSERGYFLDSLLDSVVFLSIFVGIACSGYARFGIFMFGAILYLLHDQLISLWIHLRSRQVFPRVGPTEVLVAFALFALLTSIGGGPLVTVGRVALGWFDLGGLVLLAWATVELVASARRLYGLLT